MQLLFFMEQRLADFERQGDRERAERLRKIIREYKIMSDAEQTTLSGIVLNSGGSQEVGVNESRH